MYRRSVAKAREVVPRVSHATSVGQFMHVIMKLFHFLPTTSHSLISGQWDWIASDGRQVGSSLEKYGVEREGCVAPFRNDARMKGELYVVYYIEVVQCLFL